MRSRISSFNCLQKNDSGSVLVALVIGLCLSALVGGGIYMWKEGALNDYKDRQDIKIKSLEKEIDQVKTERDDLLKQLDVSGMRLKETEEKKNAAEWDLIQVKEKYAGVLDTLKPLEKTIEALKSENAALKKKIDEFQSTVAAYEKEQKKMQTLVSNLKNNVAAQKNDTDLEEAVSLESAAIPEVEKPAAAESAGAAESPEKSEAVQDENTTETQPAV
jgi:predicted  nucleic acid-binding Zn-ribbon protein